MWPAKIKTKSLGPFILNLSNSEQEDTEKNINKILNEPSACHDHWPLAKWVSFSKSCHFKFLKTLYDCQHDIVDKYGVSIF